MVIALEENMNTAGPKECADDTILIILNAKGKDAKRIELVKNILLSTKTNVEIVELVENDVSEILSPMSFIVRLNLIMNALADLLYKDQEFSFKIGGKVTLVENEAK